jgi:cytochrome P450
MKTVDLFSPQFVEKPYEEFAQLRHESPVCKVAPIGYYGLTRYADVAEAIANPALYSSKAMTDPNAVFPEIRRYLETEALVAMDPPKHGKTRRVITSAFSVRIVNALEPRIRVICRDLLDRIADPRRFDLIADFAMPLPVTVICELLGVAPESRVQFKRWSDDILRTLPVTNMPEGPDKDQAKKEVEGSYRELEAFLTALIEDRRVSPREDLISAMANDGERVSTQDVISLARLLLIAGSETTTNFIALGIRILVRNKELLAALRADRSLIPAFTEEALRYDGPTMAVLRILTDDVHLHGEMLKKGDRVALFLSSANHDEARYPNPEVFDMTRTADHLAFGKSNHFCVGANLARMEFKIALEMMLDRFSEFSFGDKGFAQSALILQVFRYFDLQTKAA